MEFHSAGPLPVVPDDLTIPQFMFDYKHPNRPERDPNSPWMIENDTGRQFLHEDIRRRTFALANALHIKYNLSDDDVVLIFSRNHTDYPIMIFAVHMLGGITSGANPDFHVNELVYQINETKPALIVALPECLDTAQKAADSAGIPSDRILVFNVPAADIPESYVTVDALVAFGEETKSDFQERKLKPGEAKTKVALLGFSSGTTGNPKAVAITHYGIIANIIQLAAHNRVNEDYCSWEDRRFRPGDVVNGVLPFYHAYGIHINLLYCLFAGMTYVLFPKFNYVKMLEGIVRYRITHLMLVPPLVVLMCKHAATKKYDLSHIRLIMCGAAPLSAEVCDQLYQRFPQAHIGQVYGMTELCSVNVMFSIDNKRGKLGSSGVLLPGVTLKISRGDGTYAGYDEEGELVIKTASMALGYANNKQATEETFLDGWVKTGDIGKITRDGEIFVVDRMKELMKVKAYPVAPAELEGCLLDHPDVASTCVVGKPDEYSGELPLAFVVLRPATAERVARDPQAGEDTKRSIIQHVADNKAKYKHLTGGVEFISSIPTSPSGKLLRRILRDKARAIRA
ncbi:hypothetical protein M378DRAFT_111242 [Amanita muscaria Koide BX008]|uniref:Uncharacterized protein n=1 Tax=Amanita muscaria (strain Koide BX008) TaxID=946122 RepID=A0A0C2WCZ3_AMAMK|nr:hypothetical protein M378DRAFT_111242 [Amanita muscaria Koide BX008]